MNHSTRNLVAPIAIFLGLATCGLANPPELTHLSPLAVSPGLTCQVVFHGQHLQSAQQVWMNLAGQATLDFQQSEEQSGGKSIPANFEIPADARPGIYAARLTTKAGVSPPILFMVDDLKSTPEAGNNQDQQSAQLLHAPVAVDGAGAGTESDYYCLDMLRGQWLTIDVVAARLGYAFDPLLRIFDAAGNDLAVVDDSEGLCGDCHVRFQSPQDQRVYIQVSDARLSNSARHKYRMRIGDFPLAQVSFPLVASHSAGHYANPSIPSVDIPTEPPNHCEQTAFSVKVPSALNARFESPGEAHYYRLPLASGDRLRVRGIARSLGSAADLLFQWVAPNGEVLATYDDSGLEEASFEFVADSVGEHLIIIREINRRFGPAYSYRCEVTEAQPAFELNADKDRLNIGQGGVGLLSVSCKRNGYDGPITLQFTNPQDDFQLENHIIKRGVSETLLKVIPNSDLPVGKLQMLGLRGMGEKAKAGDAGEPPSACLNIADALRARFPAMAYPPAELLDLLAVSIAAPISNFYGLRLASEEILFPRIVGETYFTVYCTDRMDGYKDPINLVALNLPDKVKVAGHERPVGNSQNNEYRFAVNGPADLPLGTHRISVRAVGEYQGQSQAVVLDDIPFRIVEPLMVTFEVTPQSGAPGELTLSIKARRFVAREGGDRKVIICRWKEPPKWLAGPDSFAIEAGKDEQTFAVQLRSSPGLDQSTLWTPLIMLAETTIDGQPVHVESAPYDVAKLAAELVRPD
jgi:hypothetical protein